MLKLRRPGKIGTSGNPGLQLTSAAGFPPTETHCNFTSRSSIAWTEEPSSIRGGSGGARTINLAYLDLIAGSPVKKIRHYFFNNKALFGMLFGST